MPCAPVQKVAELAAHPQTQALGILRGEDGGPGKIRSLGLPLTFEGIRPGRDDACPALGEATELYLGHKAAAE